MKSFENMTAMSTPIGERVYYHPLTHPPNCTCSRNDLSNQVPNLAKKIRTKTYSRLRISNILIIGRKPKGKRQTKVTTWQTENRRRYMKMHCQMFLWEGTVGLVTQTATSCEAEVVTQRLLKLAADVGLVLEAPSEECQDAEGSDAETTNKIQKDGRKKKKFS